MARTLALAVMLALSATPVLSHAIVIEAKPAPGETVASPDLTVTLRYNGRLDHARSRLTLVGPDGASKQLSIATDTSPDSLVTSLTGLAPGAYRLRWHVLSVDGHITRGEVPFRVSAP
jgi:hypothetical protein